MSKQRNIFWLLYYERLECERLTSNRNESRSHSAKGKDFATSLGAHLVTKEELDVYRNGDRYNLEMTAHVNGKLLSKGNFQDIYYTFAEMIERASEDVTLYPGDVIGSGQ